MSHGSIVPEGIFGPFLFISVLPESERIDSGPLLWASRCSTINTLLIYIMLESVSVPIRGSQIVSWWELVTLEELF